jgi:hypothetical protein
MPMRGRCGTIRVHLPGRNGETEFADLSDLRMQYDDSKIVRTSVGVGLTWQAPIGPLRFDYAVPINKGKYDVTIQVRRRDVVWIHRGVAMLIAGRDRLCNRGKADRSLHIPTRPTPQAATANGTACQF